MERLQHFATKLDHTAQRRDDNEFLLKQLPLLMQDETPSDSESEEESARRGSLSRSSGSPRIRLSSGSR